LVHLLLLIFAVLLCFFFLGSAVVTLLQGISFLLFHRQVLLIFAMYYWTHVHFLTSPRIVIVTETDMIETVAIQDEMTQQTSLLDHSEEQVQQGNGDNYKNAHGSSNVEFLVSGILMLVVLSRVVLVLTVSCAPCIRGILILF
jgi:hypothetical protein